MISSGCIDHDGTVAAPELLQQPPMYIYLEIWKPRDEWRALSLSDRDRTLQALHGALERIVEPGVELVGGFWHNAAGEDQQDPYITVWKFRGADLLERVEVGVRASGVDRYFERSALHGETPLMPALAGGTPVASGERRGLSGWITRLGGIFQGSPEKGETARPAPQPEPIASAASIPAIPVAQPEPVKPPPLPESARAPVAAAEPPEAPAPPPEPVAPPVAVVIEKPSAASAPWSPTLPERRIPDYVPPRIPLRNIPPGEIDVAAYLQRIGYDGPLEPTIATLRALHALHLQHIPFENLDISLGASIVLDEQRIFEKVVRGHRGGFCYELNGLFAALLRSLGYNVTLLSVSVTHGADGYGPEFDHMALMVKLEERWLVDVGFGDSFAEPLEIDRPGEQRSGGDVYRIDNDAGVRRLMRRNSFGKWDAQYLFTLLPHRLEDFSGMCDYHQTSPASHFTRGRICTRVTPEGRVTLTDTKLIETISGKQREYRLENQREFLAKLREKFGMEISLEEHLPA